MQWDRCQSACGCGEHAGGAAVMQQEYLNVCEDARSHHAERTTRKDHVPTSVMLVLSRTQVHALRGFDVLDLPLVLVLGGRLGLSRAGDVRLVP